MPDRRNRSKTVKKAVYHLPGLFEFDLMEMAQKCDLNDQVKQSMGQMIVHLHSSHR